MRAVSILLLLALSAGLVSAGPASRQDPGGDEQASTALIALPPGTCHAPSIDILSVAPVFYDDSVDLALRVASPVEEVMLECAGVAMTPTTVEYEVSAGGDDPSGDVLVVSMSLVGASWTGCTAVRREFEDDGVRWLATSLCVGPAAAGGAIIGGTGPLSGVANFGTEDSPRLLVYDIEPTRVGGFAFATNRVVFVLDSA